MNWTDEIKTDFDVSISVTATEYQDLVVEFSRIPDILVHQELMLISQKPGYKVEISQDQTKYVILKPKLVKALALVQPISKMLEKHNLVVSC